MNTPPVVSREEWTEAREEMLVEEKAMTRARDALAAKRRRMPWQRVEKDYVFEGPDGEMSFGACSRAAGSSSSTGPSTRRASRPPRGTRSSPSAPAAAAR